MNEFPSDQVLLDKNSLMLLMNSCYNVFNASNDQALEGSSVLPETFHVQSQLPAFVARFLEREKSLSDNCWAVVDGSIPQSMQVLPNLTTSLDWALRLTEAGRAGSLIQKYNDRPLLSAAGHKMCLRLSLFVKSIAPL